MMTNHWNVRLSTLSLEKAGSTSDIISSLFSYQHQIGLWLVIVARSALHSWFSASSFVLLGQGSPQSLQPRPTKAGKFDVTAASPLSGMEVHCHALLPWKRSISELTTRDIDGSSRCCLCVSRHSSIWCGSIEGVPLQAWWRYVATKGTLRKPQVRIPHNFSGIC